MLKFQKVMNKQNLLKTRKISVPALPVAPAVGTVDARKQESHARHLVGASQQNVKTR
mgnify:CR=1 FL=1